MKRQEASAWAPASPEVVFDTLDDFERLARHMARPSLMMGGGRMTYAFGKGRGRHEGALIRMSGSAFGLRLQVDEVVTKYAPPFHKVWETVGAPSLIVIGGYRMGFDISGEAGGSHICIWVEYDPPERGPGRWAPFLSDGYARWCVNSMLADMSRRLAAPTA